MSLVRNTFLGITVDGQHIVRRLFEACTDLGKLILGYTRKTLTLQRADHHRPPQ